MKLKLPPATKRFTLRPNPIPVQLWSLNLRNLCEAKVWFKLREQTLEQDNYQCAAQGCHTVGPLHCHEDWEIDAEKRTQRLKQLVTLCEKCHACVHFGRTLNVETKKFTQDIIRHYAQVTDISVRKANKELNKVLTKLTETYNYFSPWTISFGEWLPLIRKDRLTALIERAIGQVRVVNNSFKEDKRATKS